MGARAPIPWVRTVKCRRRSRALPQEGHGDGTAACDIDAVEFFPIFNDLVTLDPDLDTDFDPTPGAAASAGTCTITATFTTTSDTALYVPFFTMTEFSGDNLVLKAEEGTQGEGATLTLEAEDRLLSPGETVAVDFRIGLHTEAPFRFLVDLFAEPLP
jgi:hypothetical protein